MLMTRRQQNERQTAANIKAKIEKIKAK